MVALCALLAAIWLAMLVGGTGSLDVAIYRALYIGDHSALTPAAIFVTDLGAPQTLIIASFVIAAILWATGHVRTGAVLLAVVLLGRALSQIQKMEIARVRPDIEPHLVAVTSKSFPSGHASSAMVFYLTLALLLTHRSPWRRWAAAAAILLAILIGMSRVMLGVHWPSDVIGGWVFGLLWVLLTVRAAERLLIPASSPEQVVKR